METSQSISRAIAKLKLAYPYYFDKLKNEADENDETFLMFISMFQEHLAGYSSQVLDIAITNIIHNSKFMPTINELINECDKSIGTFQNTILTRMKEDGYFKRAVVGELDDIQATRNYEKACSFVECGIIPNWLLEDMKKYGYQEHKKELTTSNKENLLISNLKLLGGNDGEIN